MPGLRGEGAALPPARDRVGLPPRPFLYTLDQISVMLDISESQIKAGYIFFIGRSIGTQRKDLMIARNIAPTEAQPDWRVAEREFIRWMRYKGFRFYERSTFSG